MTRAGWTGIVVEEQVAVQDSLRRQKILRVWRRKGPAERALMTPSKKREC